MFTAIRGGLVLLAVGVALPHVAEAQMFGRTVMRNKTVIRNRACATCQQDICTCAPAPPPAPCMTLKPVYDTQYRQEQCVVNRSFTETHFRDETFTTCVPVTKCDTICVDEGCFQQIWVPKMVTKVIPKTVYEARVGCRQVPYQVTKCAPEILTRQVPFQTVRYVPAPSCCVPSMPSCGAPGQPSCGAPGNMNYPLPPANSGIYTPTGPATLAPLGPQASASPLTDPRYLAPLDSAPTADAFNDSLAQDTSYDDLMQNDPPRRIPRAGANARFENGRAEPLPTNSMAGTESSRGRFTPAPSAATVWRTPRGNRDPLISLAPRISP